MYDKGQIFQNGLTTEVDIVKDMLIQQFRKYGEHIPPIVTATFSQHSSTILVAYFA